jgi:hypothetical protein
MDMRLGTGQKKGKMPPMKQNRDGSITLKPGQRLSPEQFLAVIPEQFEQLLVNAIQVNNQTKTQLIQRLTANLSGEALERKTKWLQKKDLSDLQEMLDIAAPAPQRRQPNPVLMNFLGAAGGPAGGTGPTGNKSGDDDDDKDILELPTVNWAEEARQQRRAE